MDTYTETDMFNNLDTPRDIYTEEVPVDVPTPVEDDIVTPNEQDEAPQSPVKKAKTAPESVVTTVLESARSAVMTDDGTKTVRKAVSVTAADRKKARKRGVDTDLSVSDLVNEAVLDLLRDKADVPSPANAKRPNNITVSAPSWWWFIAKLFADAHDVKVDDVVAHAIKNYLP